MSEPLLGGVEAGGTKMVCAVANEPGVVLDEVRFPTTSSEETLLRGEDYFEQAQMRL
jgi:fructokinase